MIEMNQKTKIRIIMGGIHIFTTVGKYMETIGTPKHREAVTHCLQIMKRDECRGVVTEYQGIGIQVNT